MNVMNPCLLSVSGIPNSHILRASVSVRRNNAIKTAELTLYQTNPPNSITISYSGTQLFTGKLVSVMRQPCGRLTARYESPPPPSVAQTTLFIALYYLVYNWSPSLVRMVNDHIQTRSQGTGYALRPVDQQTLFFPTGLSNQYLYVHPFYNNIRWRVYVWYYVGNKARLLQKSTWETVYPPLQQVYGLEGVLDSVFGGYQDTTAIYGSFIVVEESQDTGGSWYWTMLYWQPRGTDNVGKVVADSSCLNLAQSASFTIVLSPLDTVADILESLGFNRAGQNARVVKEVLITADSNLLDFVRQYCKGVVIRTAGTSYTYSIFDTLAITTTHNISEHAVFDFSLPRLRLANVVLEYEPAWGTEVHRNKIVRGITYANAIDTIRIKTQDFIPDSEYFNRTVRQVLEDVQLTGYIRTIILPSVEAYDIVSFAGETFRVTAFTHEVSEKGAFTNIEIIPEVQL